MKLVSNFKNGFFGNCYNSYMYILASSMSNLPILSLHTGQTIGVVDAPVINPDNLQIVALYCGSGPWRKRTSVIMTRDIREIAREGLVIDSLEDIEDASEIVRLGSIVEQNYNPIGMPVVTQTGDQLGKIEDYTVDVADYRIQKLYLKQSLLKNLLLNNIVVDRSQIVDVTPRAIIVRDATAAANESNLPNLAPQPLPQE